MPVIPLTQVCKCFQRPVTFLRSSNTLKGASAMKKSSAIFVSAIALGLAMVVPLKASAQGVTIYIGPQGYGAGYPAYDYYAPYPPSYSYSYPSYGYAYPSYGYGYTAVRATALIGAKVDALLAELIGDGIAGIRTLTLYARAACLGRIRIRRREAQQRKRKATHCYARWADCRGISVEADPRVVR